MNTRSNLPKAFRFIHITEFIARLTSFILIRVCREGALINTEWTVLIMLASDAVVISLKTRNNFLSDQSLQGSNSQLVYSINLLSQAH